MLNRLGFIGAGAMAQAHAKAASQLGAEIVLVANTNPDSANLKAFLNLVPHAMATTSPREHRDLNIDAWVVTTPWNVTPELVPALLAHPEPMLIEKPISIHGRNFPTGKFESNKFVAFNRRFYEPVVALKEAVELGTVKSAVVTISDMIDHIVRRFGAEILPYAMDMWAVHILDLVCYLFGKVEIVWQCINEGPSGYLNIEAVLVTQKNKIPIHLSINANDSSPVGIRVQMGDGTTHVLAPIERLTTYGSLEVQETDGVRSYQACQTQQISCPDDGFKPGIYGQMQAFLEQDLTRLVTVLDAHQIHNVIQTLGEQKP